MWSRSHIGFYLLQRLQYQYCEISLWWRKMFILYPYDLFFYILPNTLNRIQNFTPTANQSETSLILRIKRKLQSFLQFSVLKKYFQTNFNSQLSNSLVLDQSFLIKRTNTYWFDLNEKESYHPWDHKFKLHIRDGKLGNLFIQYARLRQLRRITFLWRVISSKISWIRLMGNRKETA